MKIVLVFITRFAVLNHCIPVELYTQECFVTVIKYIDQLTKKRAYLKKRKTQKLSSKKQSNFQCKIVKRQMTRFNEKMVFRILFVKEMYTLIQKRSDSSTGDFLKKVPSSATWALRDRQIAFIERVYTVRTFYVKSAVVLESMAYSSYILNYILYLTIIAMPCVHNRLINLLFLVIINAFMYNVCTYHATYLQFATFLLLCSMNL